MSQVSKPRMMARVVKAWWHRFQNRMNNTAEDLPGLENIDRVHWVQADDGANLRVYEVGPEGRGELEGQEETCEEGETCSRQRNSGDADSAERVTIVYAHGFTLSAQSWCFQAEAMRREARVARQLIPDLRGHGGSSGGNKSDRREVDLSVDLTAQDFVEIIRELAPHGPLLLVGHSLGVMTVLGALRCMTAAERTRVQGIALVNGAVDAFAARGFPRILRALPIGAIRAAGRHTPAFAEGLKERVEWMIKPVIAATVYFGSLEQGETARYDIVDFHAKEIESVPMRTITGYLQDLTTHDEKGSLPYVRDIPGIILAGREDAVSTPEQSEVLVQQWPKAELRELDEAGHMLPVERPEDVNRALRQLL